MTRVAVIIKPAVGTRYLAERERDPEREGDTRRPLFSNELSDLTPAQANTFLHGGARTGKLDDRDVIHLVVSPADVTAFERLGDETDARTEAFKNCTREMMREFEERLGITDTRWIAGIHLNTDHPHVHILVQRQATNAETGLPQRIEHLPRELMMHRRAVEENQSPEHTTAATAVSPERLRAVSSVPLSAQVSEATTSTKQLPTIANQSTAIRETLKPLVRDDGALGHAFRASLERHALPVRGTAFRIDNQPQLTRREVCNECDGLAPTRNEKLVGAWLVAEARNTGNNTPAQAETRLLLRDEVQRLDEKTTAQGRALTRAFVSESTLNELLRDNRIQATRPDGTLAPRYHRAAEWTDKVPLRFRDLTPAHGGQIIGVRCQDSGALIAREVIPITPARDEAGRIINAFESPGHAVKLSNQEPQRGALNDDALSKRTIIFGYHTSVPGRELSARDTMDLSDGMYIALDKPFDRDGGIIKRKVIALDLQKIFDPNGLLQGTNQSHSQADWKRFDESFKREEAKLNLSTEGLRGIAGARTRALQKLGYEGEVGWIDGVEGHNRELVVFAREQVKDATAAHRDTGIHPLGGYEFADKGAERDYHEFAKEQNDKLSRAENLIASLPITSSSKQQSRFERVTLDKPCEFCGRPDDCAVTSDGTKAYCRRPERATERHGASLETLKLTEGRDGGWLLDRTRLTGYVAHPAKPEIEVTKYPLAPVERRDTVYRAMLAKLELIARDQVELTSRGMTEGSRPRDAYRSVPVKDSAHAIARELAAEGHDLRGVPGFWRDTKAELAASSQSSPSDASPQPQHEWRLVMSYWHRGFLVPVKDEQGRIQAFQIRRAEPAIKVDDVTGKETKEAKYVWLSSDNTAKHPRPEGTSPGSPLHFVNPDKINDTNHVIITEGALKADIAACLTDCAVVGVQGVGNFPVDVGARLKRLGVDKAFIAYDADSFTNPAVARQENRLAETLHNAGIETARLTWNIRDGKGIDDYLVGRLGLDFNARVTDSNERRKLQTEALRDTNWSEPQTAIAAGMRDAVTGKIVTTHQLEIADWLRREAETASPHDDLRLNLLRMNATSLDADSRAHAKPVTPAAIDARELRRGLEAGIYLSRDDLIDRQRADDRLIIGREAEVQLELVHANWKYQSCLEQSEIRRYQARDASTGITRTMSRDDLAQRATARSYRATDEAGELIASLAVHEQTPTRQTIFDNQQSLDKQQHVSTADQIQQTHARELTGWRDKLIAAYHNHDAAVLPRLALERDYRAHGEAPPAPAFQPDALDRLTEAAYERRDNLNLRKIDGWRQTLATDGDSPAYSEASAARLAAQKRLADGDYRAAARRESKFNDNCHNHRWELESEDKKWSLAEVDRDLHKAEREREYHEAQTGFFGKHGFLKDFLRTRISSLNPLNSLRPQAFNPLNPILNDPTLKVARFGFNLYRWAERTAEARTLSDAATDKIEQLTLTRTAVSENILNRKLELTTETNTAAQFKDTVDELHEANTTARMERGVAEAQPRYTSREMRRMEATASTLRDTAMLRDYETLAGMNADPELRSDLAARATGREILSEARVASAEKSLSRFTDNINFTQVAFRDADGALETGCLRDIAPRTWLSPLKQLFRPEADIRRESAIRDAVQAKQLGLENELHEAQNWHAANTEIAAAYREELATTIEPRFTAREAAELERLGGGLTPREIENLKSLADLTPAQLSNIRTSETVIEALREGRIGYLNLPETETHLTVADDAMSPLAASPETTETSFSASDSLEFSARLETNLISSVANPNVALTPSLDALNITPATDYEASPSPMISSSADVTSTNTAAPSAPTLDTESKTFEGVRFEETIERHAEDLQCVGSAIEKGQSAPEVEANQLVADIIAEEVEVEESISLIGL